MHKHKPLVDRGAPTARNDGHCGERADKVAHAENWDTGYAQEEPCTRNKQAKARGRKMKEGAKRRQNRRRRESEERQQEARGLTHGEGAGDEVCASGEASDSVRVTGGRACSDHCDCHRCGVNGLEAAVKRPGCTSQKMVFRGRRQRGREGGAMKE